MKAVLKYLFAASLIMTIVPPAVSSSDIPLDPDYGTELNITTGYRFPDFDLFGKDHFSRTKLWPIWSPDGKSLVFYAAQRLWIVSSEGGNARLLYEKVYEVNGISCVVASPLPIGFTSDGKEVIFSDWAFDENRGAQINVTQTSYSFSKPASDIFAVNIETGELRLIVSNGGRGSLSRDGRYLCYLYFDWKSRFDDLQTENHNAPTILDLVTGDSWFLSNDQTFNDKIFTKPMFSADNSHVIFQIYDKETLTSKLYQIPLNGGNPEPYNFYDGTAISEFVSGGMSGFGMSSDGTWTLYTSQNYSITVQDSVPKYDDEGNYTGYYSFMHNVVRVCVYNNITGDNYYLLPPYPYVTTQDGKFSPDDKKFCYVLRDDYNREKIGRIFVKDFDVNTLEKISVISAVKTNGPEQFATIKNYPNPFNPSTTIEFNLTKPVFATLSVYNLTGQKVCELATGKMTAGKHSYIWDGRNSNGTPVSSGVLFTRLETRDNVISNRMMLVK